MFTTTASAPRAAANSQPMPLMQQDDFVPVPAPPRARRMLVDGDVIEITTHQIRCTIR